MTRQRRENLTGAAIGDPTEDNGKGTGGTAPSRIWSDIITSVAQDAVAEEAINEHRKRSCARGVMEITQIPPPPRLIEDAGQRS